MYLGRIMYAHMTVLTCMGSGAKAWKTLSQQPGSATARRCLFFSLALDCAGMIDTGHPDSDCNSPGGHSLLSYL